MKKVLIVLVTWVFAAHVMAQDTKPVQRTISANGSSEIEVVPDEIYVQVDLREYNKKNGDKVDINTIKNNFLAACKSIGLTEKDVTVQSYQGYDNNYWWWKKNKKQNPDMKASVSYWIKVSKVDTLDALVDKMDDEATQNFFIAKTSYSKMDEVKKDLKVAAVKAARDKAIYLAEAIGEQVGQAVTINEPAEVNQPQPVYANAMLKAANAENFSQPPMDVDFKKIKIQFDVNVVFALK
jgi:uncharacterized protein YggE